MGTISAVNYAGKKYTINDTKEIARGGEGVVYELNTNTVAKIYHDGIIPITQNKFDFIKKLDKTLFIAPQELLFNSKSNIIGFTMEYLGNDFYPLSNIYVKSFCQSHSIDKKVKLRIIEQIIKAVEYAHKLNIVIGDLNCFNIMMNNAGDIKLIDTDSYQTPGNTHSGRMMDEIRDYLYQGKIDNNSDFFALSILAFNMLAFTHPFKGIHKQYLKISDRMIHKVPIFVNDSDLKPPKCYEPIQDINFMGQFERYYLHGERFLLSLTDVNPNLIVMAVNKPSNITKYDKGDLVITSILDDDSTKQIIASDNYLVIETGAEFKLFNVRNKGYVTMTDVLSKKDYSKVYVGNKNIILKKDNELFTYIGKGKVNKLNFKLADKYLEKQFEDILVVVESDRMYKIFIDETIGSNIKMSAVNVYGNGFKRNNGLMYNSGGGQNIFYNESGKELAILNSPMRINDLYQDKNIGIVQYREKTTMKYKFCKINNMKLNMSGSEVDGFSNFAFRKNPDGEGFVFIPKDNKISILRTQDFSEVSQMDCDLVSSESVIKNTHSGLILFEEGKVWLLNKK